MNNYQSNFINNKLSNILLLVVNYFFLIIVFLINDAYAIDNKEITVIFRYDDYSSLSPINIDKAIISIFQKNNMACTFGVIPCISEKDSHSKLPQALIPLNQTKADILKEAVKMGIVDVALHGFSHQTVKENSYFGHSEFSGVDYKDQFIKIQSGKTYLEKILGLKISTFIPPWNSYDLNTILALENLGFTCISDGDRGVTKISSPLWFLPVTCWDLLDLKTAIKSARSIEDQHPVIIALMHPYDFIEVDTKKGRNNFLYLNELLAWLNSQSDIKVLSIKQLLLINKELSVQRYKDFSSYNTSILFIPARLKSFFNGIYFHSSTSKHMEILAWAFVITLYISIFIIVTLLTNKTILIMHNYDNNKYIYYLIRLIGLMVAILMIYHSLKVSLPLYKRTILIVAFLGFCTGIFKHILKKRSLVSGTEIE